MVTISDWRCPTPRCGHKLANRVVVRQGWLERKCRTCPPDVPPAHVGDARNGQPGRWLKCTTPGCHKNAADVSIDWRGELACKCKWCRREVVLTA